MNDKDKIRVDLGLCAISVLLAANLHNDYESVDWNLFLLNTTINYNEENVIKVCLLINYYDNKIIHLNEIAKSTISEIRNILKDKKGYNADITPDNIDDIYYFQST